MGRKPTRWLNLPKGMRARPRGQKVFYYLDTGEKPRRELPLGSDYALAVAQWAKLTNKVAPETPAGTFPFILEKYWEEVFPHKSAGTQLTNEKEREWLLKFFGDPPAPLDKIEPKHMKDYLRWRVKATVAARKEENEQRKRDGKPPLACPENLGHVRANREKALFSHVWNHAREEGYTALPNPCFGIKGHKEDGRDVYVEDELLTRVMAKAVKPLQFAIRLYHLTGQRPGDGLRMSESHISNGLLHVRQGKTQAKLRIVIEGELKALLDDMKAYKAEVTPMSKVRTLSLMVNEKGQKYTVSMLRNDFDAAREKAGINKAEFQIRDLRAKAATEVDDADGTRAAQGLLGHTTETMTTDYIRHKVGKKVKPLR